MLLHSLFGACRVGRRLLITMVVVAVVDVDNTVVTAAVQWSYSNTMRTCPLLPCLAHSTTTTRWVPIVTKKDRGDIIGFIVVTL